MKNIDFDRLEARAAESADVIRGAHWCSREGQAQLLELMEAGDRRLVFAGCTQDFAARRLQKLYARGLQMDIADIREGCSWVHGDDVAAVTDKAMRIVASSVSTPTPWPTHGLRRAPRHGRGDRRRRGRHAGRRGARQDGTSGRAHRAAALPRRPRRPHRHRLPHQRLRPVPARRRRTGRHTQVLPPQRLHRPPRPHRPSPRHRRGRHRPPRRLRGECPPPAQPGDRRLHQLRDLRDRLRGRGVGARQEGHLHRVLRRPRRAHHRPRHVHLLRQVRRGVPCRGHRLQPVA